MNITSEKMTRPYGMPTYIEKYHLNGKDYEYYTQLVGTKHGYVRVYSESRFALTTLTAMVNGRIHQSKFKKYYKPRYTVTLANRFMKQIHEL